MLGFEAIASDHYRRYPLMEPQDFGKLAYQSEFGPEHLVEDAQGAAAYILQEWQTVPASNISCNPEPIGSGLCRFHMTREMFSPENAAELAALFVRSAREHTGTSEGLEARIKHLSQLPVDGMEAWLSAWREQSCPPVHHSEAFRHTYRPHYRILQTELADNFLARIRTGR